MNAHLADLQSRIEQLSMKDQLLLIERLINRLRRESEIDNLAEMAHDPQIQAELKRIDDEFRGTELDGLEKAG
jgi:hypothetical protein